MNEPMIYTNDKPATEAQLRAIIDNLRNQLAAKDERINRLKGLRDDNQILQDALDWVMAAGDLQFVMKLPVSEWEEDAPNEPLVELIEASRQRVIK